ncbi:uncharacterized protein LOC108930670 isoform X2 [Scleropages formosus]|uniref:uncharacterized protein LOC108930670 isoform X2 n=1 Tax=Scleropages formosus TaxID=113540 RepID=UPI0008784966|nr:uncharacterized protein LOC108930670 isoform X2 [Scleropages formosus]
MFVSRLLRMAALSPSMPKRHVIWETDELVAYLHTFPWTPGATILTQKSPTGPCSIFQLAEPEFLGLLLGARAVGHLLCKKLGVRRCALVSRPIAGQSAHVRILPLHGLEPDWRPHLAAEEDFQPHDPGYCSSKSGPRWNHTELEEVKAKIRAKLPDPGAPPSFAFLGDPTHDGLFSRIVRGKEQQWRVWEDDSHVAFLTPFPNAPGLTVLVPRQPLTSDIFRLDEDNYKALILASRKVAQLLQDGLGAHGVALIFEGYEIDYAHAKLIPLLPPPGEVVTGPAPSFCPKYPGYVTSGDGPTASKESLLEMQVKIIQP